MATSASNPDVGLVLAAASPRALFGDDEDGARRTYRRLAKSVHPDANGNSRDSAEAMARLNRMWSEYRGRRLTEITRNDTYAIFSEDGWLVVERRAEGRPRRFADGLGDVLDGSPVCQVKPVETNS